MYIKLQLKTNSSKSIYNLFDYIFMNKDEYGFF